MADTATNGAVDAAGSVLGTIGSLTGGPIGGIIGSVLGAAGNFFGTSSANQANKDLAYQQQEFQRYMDNTKYRRTVRDLIAAGLNPMLAYTNGPSASTPPGARAEMQNAMGPAVNSGMAGAAMMSQIENIKADTAKKESEAAVNAATIPEISQRIDTGAASAHQLRSMAALNSAQYNNVLEQAWHEAEKRKLTVAEQKLMIETIENARRTGKLIEANTGNVRVDTLLKNLEVPGARNEAEAQGSWWKRTISPYIKDAGALANSAESIANPANRFRLNRFIIHGK